MKTIILCLNILFLLCANKAYGQRFTESIEKLSFHRQTTEKKINVTRSMDCDPDSILYFSFNSPNDSIYDSKEEFHNNGEGSSVIYQYINVEDGLELRKIDSTVYDVNGKPIINEVWDFDFDSNAIILYSRMLIYPHEGNIIKDYSFLDHMSNVNSYKDSDFIEYDSLISYQLNQVSGLFIPYFKIIQEYSSSGLLERRFFYDFRTTKITKREFYYTSSNRIEREEYFTWDEIDEYTLDGISTYNYDSNDSLLFAVYTNNETGQEEEKLEMSYNLTENSTTAKIYFWDNENNLWYEYRVYAVFDIYSRVEVLEDYYNAFGFSFISRNEYVYIGEERCPHHVDIFNLNDTIWEIFGKAYFYPFTITSVSDQPQIIWNAYPNPTNDGIWIEAPFGAQVQLTSLLGTSIYKGKINAEREHISLNQINTPIILTIQYGTSLISEVIMVNK